MDKVEAAPSVGQDAILEVRVELVDSVPATWRQLEIRGSLGLSQVHQVLQAAFGWEDAHLHRFVITSDPFAPLRPVDGEFQHIAVVQRRSCRILGNGFLNDLDKRPCRRSFSNRENSCIRCCR